MVDNGRPQGVWYEVLALREGMEMLTYQGESREEALTCAREDSKRWCVEVREYDHQPDWDGADWAGCAYTVIDYRER